MKRTPMPPKRERPRRSGKPLPRIKAKRLHDPAHLARVASLPCCACGASPVEVHHIRDGVGMGQRASDHETIPLCPYHHRTGPTAFHAGPRYFEALYGTERELLAETLERLNGLEAA